MKRTYLALASALLCGLIAGCGGGGGGGGGGGNSDNQTPADLILASGCTANVLNKAKYDGITFGHIQSYYRDYVGCKTLFDHSVYDEWYSQEKERRAYLFTSYDNSGFLRLKTYEERLTSVPPSMTDPLAATCTAAHVNIANFNAISMPGLTPNAAAQAIGCAPTVVNYLSSLSLSGTWTSYYWEIPESQLPTAPIRRYSKYIMVGFDDATGLSGTWEKQGF